jgi:LPS export ABC transporter protein LptC
VIFAATLAVLAGCGPPLPAPEAERGPSTPEQAAEATMQNMTLRLYGAEGGDASGKPAFWVQAEQSTLLEEGVWAFENARAIIYGREGNETLLEAAHGQVDQREGRETALLDENVSLRAGDMTMQLQELEWINAERMARSDAPVTMEGQGSAITASALRYYPDEQRMVLKEVRGTLVLKGEDPL